MLITDFLHKHNIIISCIYTGHNFDSNLHSYDISITTPNFNKYNFEYTSQSNTDIQIKMLEHLYLESLYDKKIQKVFSKDAYLDLENLVYDTIT